MMRLSELAALLPSSRILGDPETEVRALADDSRRVAAGSLFVAVRGADADGHAFLEEAARRGAAAAVIENEARLTANLPALVVPDSRLALAILSHRFHGDPTRRLALVAVTGTNGKTTTAYLVHSILGAAGLAPGLLGTVVYRTGEREVPAGNTTPGALGLAETFGEMVRARCRSAVFEVSSHALDQGRVAGCHVDVACFTNLTRDHLDYHRTEEAYYAAKRRLFTEILDRSEKSRRTAVLNVDDPLGRRLAEELAAGHPALRVITVSASGADAADVRVLKGSADLAGTSAQLQTPHGTVWARSRLVGRFNLDNIAAAVACGVALGIDLAAIARGVAELAGVPGRMERVDGGEIAALVDYAHTGDALSRAVAAVRELVPGRLLTVFGCGGDRDRGKRPIMGRAAAAGSDLAIITSDNPRTEDPAQIIAEILPGVRETGARELTPEEATEYGGRGFLVEPDRRAAIRLAVRLARPGDVILIAGKGHEDYQILGREKIHFDDREEARAALVQRGAGR